MRKKTAILSFAFALTLIVCTLTYCTYKTPVTQQIIVPTDGYYLSNEDDKLFAQVTGNYIALKTTDNVLKSSYYFTKNGNWIRHDGLEGDFNQVKDKFTRVPWYKLHFSVNGDSSIYVYTIQDVTGLTLFRQVKSQNVITHSLTDPTDSTPELFQHVLLLYLPENIKGEVI